VLKGGLHVVTVTEDLMKLGDLEDLSDEVLSLGDYQADVTTEFSGLFEEMDQQSPRMSIDQLGLS